jgi:hypothetical protein
MLETRTRSVFPCISGFDTLLSIPGNRVFGSQGALFFCEAESILSARIVVVLGHTPFETTMNFGMVLPVESCQVQVQVKQSSKKW